MDAGFREAARLRLSRLSPEERAAKEKAQAHLQEVSDYFQSRSDMAELHHAECQAFITLMTKGYNGDNHPQWGAKSNWAMARDLWHLYLERKPLFFLTASWLR